LKKNSYINSNYGLSKSKGTGYLDSKLENEKNCIDFNSKCVIMTQYEMRNSNKKSFP
jgi:hypothetical protein